MRFTHKGKRITLRGIPSKITKCTPIGVRKVKGLLRRHAITHCVLMVPQLSKQRAQEVSQELHVLSDPKLLPVQPEVKKVLSTFKHLFQEPTTLPPPRKFDHHIELIHGAQPINIRPYRYIPVQKSEIEKQLADMLKNVIIRPS